MLQEASDAAFATAHATLQTYIGGIIEHPHEAACRTTRESVSGLLSTPGVHEMLLASGFHTVDESIVLPRSASTEGAEVVLQLLSAEAAERARAESELVPEPPSVSHLTSEVLAAGPRQVPSLGPFGVAEVDFAELGFQHTLGSGRYQVSVLTPLGVALRDLPLGGGQFHLEGSVSPAARLDTCRSLHSPWSHAAMRAPAGAASVAFAYPVDNMADVTLKLAQGGCTFWQYEDGEIGSEDWKVMPEARYSEALVRASANGDERVAVGEYEFVLRGQPRAPFQRNGISGKSRRIRAIHVEPLDLSDVSIAFAATSTSTPTARRVGCRRSRRASAARSSFVRALSVSTTRRRARRSSGKDASRSRLLAPSAGWV